MFDDLGNVYYLRYKHVVGHQNLVTIQVDGSKSVEAVKVDFCSLLQCADLEVTFVDPVRFSDPLYQLFEPRIQLLSLSPPHGSQRTHIFIDPFERVGDHVLGHELNLNQTGHLDAAMPALLIGVCCSRSFE